jgi:hypothetical protein
MKNANQVLEDRITLKELNYDIIYITFKFFIYMIT